MIRYGLIGVGHFGSFIHDALKQNTDIVLHAIVERNPAKAAQYAKELGAEQYYTNDEDLLHDPNVDIVVIATPPYTHTALAIEAMQQKKGVFLEKPPCITIDEIVKLKNAKKQYNGIITVDLVMRYNPLMQLLHSLVATGTFVSPKRISFNNFASDAALPSNHWFWDIQKSGGILVEHGLHFFDLYAWMLHIRPVVCKSIAARTKHPNAVDSVLGTIVYGKEIFGSYYHTFTVPQGQEYQQALVGFEHAYAVINGWIPTDVYLAGDFSVEAVKKQAAFFGCVVNDASIYGNKEKNALHISTTDSRQELYQHAVRDGFIDIVHAYTETSYQQQVPLIDALQATLTAIAARDNLSPDIFLQDQQMLANG